MYSYSADKYVSAPKRRVKRDWAVSERVTGEQRREETRTGSSIFLE